MMRGLVILGLLAGASYYAYRRVMGGGTGPVPADGPAGAGDQSAATGGITERVTQSVRQAATTARQAATTAATKVRAAAPIGGGAAAGQAQPEMEQDGSPREARAAAMAGMPAVQPPATIPEP